MKKIILGLLLTFLVQNVFSQAMSKGQNIFYVGTGLGQGNFGVAKYKKSGYVYRSSPTIHLGFEHGLSEALPNSIIGVGASLSTWFGSHRYKDNLNYGWNKRWTDVTVLAKGYYHHKDLIGENWDLYAALMIGVRYRSYTFSYTDRIYEYYDSKESGLRGAGGLSIGGRYYFTNKVGLYAEFGYGVYTNFLQAGITFKL